jgi:sigma-54 dependent transcriptional regulator, acetoin dehydrogenase operon transcriptional activator AcoR
MGEIEKKVVAKVKRSARLEEGPTAQRALIARSWKRCEGYGLDRRSVQPIYEPTGSPSGRLASLLEPVLDDVASSLIGTDTAILLSDRDARLLARRCPDPDFERFLDRGKGSPGFVWAERFAGTTALSLALETRRTFHLSSADTFASYCRATSVAAPIVSPLTERTVGAIMFVCPADVDARHLGIAVPRVLRDIRDCISDPASSQEHMLLQHFVQATSSAPPTDGVLLVSEGLMLSNPAAARMLRGAETVAIWQQATEAVASLPIASVEMRLDDRRAVAQFERVERAGALEGVLVRLEAMEEVDSDRPRSSVQRLEPSETACSTQASRSAAGAQLDREIVASATGPRRMLIVGEPGAGKLHSAKRIHALDGGGDLRLLDAAMAVVDGPDRFLRDLSAALEAADGTVVLRRADIAGKELTKAISVLLEQSRYSHARVIATGPEDLVRSGWFRHFPFFVTVPPLRERLDDMAQIVAALIEQNGGTGRMQPAAIQALMRQSWEGNITELEGVIRSVLVSRRTCDLTLRDLPDRYRDRVGRRRLSRLEQVERAAIVRALVESGGNRTEAAAELGIGRATLYRRIRAYELDEACLA